MTFDVTFSAEQACFQFVHEALDGFDPSVRAQLDFVSTGAVSLLALHAGTEAMLNHMFQVSGRLPSYDECSFRAKVEALGVLVERPVDWGREPWQSVSNLVRVRNSLTHYKKRLRGLVSSSNAWLGVPAKGGWSEKDLIRRLTHSEVASAYRACRVALLTFAPLVFAEDWEYEWLQTERFDPLVGDR